MAEPLKTTPIRAHHLLCLQGFQGYGYSPEFVANLRRVVENIKSFPDREIEIVTGGDIICSCCPHAAQAGCQKRPDSAQKIKDLDQRVLSRLDLEEGTTAPAADILARVNTRLRTIADVQDLCGDCSWKNECRWFASREQ